MTRPEVKKPSIRTFLLIAALALCLVFTSACTASKDPDDVSAAPASDQPADSNGLSANDEQQPDDTDVSEDDVAAPSDSGDEASESGPVEWVTFESDYGFTLEYPSNWVVVDDGERYAILLRPYEGTQTSFYVDTHTKEFADWTEADMVNGMISDVVRIRTSQEDVTFTDPESKELNGYPFMTQNYEVEAAEGVYHGECYYAAKGEIGFEMYYSIQPDEYEALLPTLREIALSITFVD